MLARAAATLAGERDAPPFAPPIRPPFRPAAALTSDRFSVIFKDFITLDLVAVAVSVARHLGVSRRLADLRFRQLEKDTILETITKLRLERLRRTLLSSDAPPGELARAYGFGSVTRAEHLFKARHGQPMTAYRNRASGAAE